MAEIRAYLLLIRHTFRLWKTGQLRFRLETFGLYYPTATYQSKWWRFSPRNAWLLLRQTPAYAHWLMSVAKSTGQEGKLIPESVLANLNEE